MIIDSTPIIAASLPDSQSLIRDGEGIYKDSDKGGGQVAITADNLTKTYKLYGSPLDRLKESLHPFRKKYHHDFHALKGVTFEILRGETVGIVGINGAGKSTLLKIITGVITPTSGVIKVNGRISALLELGAGFNPELTGIENIYFNGIMMGYTRDEMNDRLDSILSFADIGEFVYQPVKTYSSGMFVRLAFALGISVDPEILIIDEALSVGDTHFVQKCLRRIDKFIQEEKTILIVSHDQQAIKRNCSKVILLDSGAKLAEGSPKQIIDFYNAIIFDKSVAQAVAKESGTYSIDKKQRYGTKRANIKSVTLIDKNGNNNSFINSKDETKIMITVFFSDSIEDILIGFSIRNMNGIEVYMINTDWKNIDIANVAKGLTLDVIFKQNMSLASGKYTITAVVSEMTEAGIKRLDWYGDCLVFEVISEEKFSGICNLDSNVEINFSS